MACVLMSLRSMGATTGCDLRVLRQLCPTTSIWTVDLAYLLRRFGADVTFYTITLGANPEFASESFYRDNLNEDCARVERLFARAAAEGIAVERVSVDLARLKDYAMSGEYLIIILVDSTSFVASAHGGGRCVGVTSFGGGGLGASGGEWNGNGRGNANGRGGGSGEGGGGDDVFISLSAQGGGRSPAALVRRVGERGHGLDRVAGGSSGYTGHYIVVCGYDPTAAEFLCRDPASHRRDLVISAKALDAARRAFGGAVHS